MRRSPVRHVVIIGAGIGGLAAALDLSARGVRVTVIDKQAGPGGKMQEALVDGRAVDAGPTVLTLRPVFERLFADAGASLADEVAMTAADVLARHGWSGGATLDLFADERRSADAIAAFAGPAEARGYRAFVRAARTIHQALRASFMEADKPATPLSLMWRGGLAGLAHFTRLDPYRSLWSMVSQHFRDPRLRQLFGRYTTYCGSSPLAAPATLALIADVEREGVWLVEGGMRRLADALLRVARRHGATARFETEVAQVVVERGRAAGVRLATGERIASDAVLLTADAAALAAGQFGADAARGSRPFLARDRSFSAVTLAVVGRARGFALLRHNVLFSDDGPAEFAALAGGRMPADPTVYFCAQDRPARDDASPPQAPERLLLVLNAPADGDRHRWSAEEIDRCTTNAFTRAARCGLTLEPSACSISTPSDFERRFPATGGALYGRASHGWMASFHRPGARTAVPGLFCAGGSVHPGAGVPMAALSGRAAARAILQSRASTWSFRRAAMPGGTSTPSATTAATA